MPENVNRRIKKKFCIFELKLGELGSSGDKLPSSRINADGTNEAQSTGVGNLCGAGRSAGNRRTEPPCEGCTLSCYGSRRTCVRTRSSASNDGAIDVGPRGTPLRTAILSDLWSAVSARASGAALGDGGRANRTSRTGLPLLGLSPRFFSRSVQRWDSISEPIALRSWIRSSRPMRSTSPPTRRKKILKKLAELSVSVPEILELSSMIGQELREHLEAQAAAHAVQTLEPQYTQAPSLAVVSPDGGRIMTRAEGQRGVHEQAWKETKNACLMTMSSTPSEQDPHPELPTCFKDRVYVEQLVREVHSTACRGSQNSGEIPAISGETAVVSSPACESSAVQPVTKESRTEWRPQRLVRTCVSSMVSSDEFGPLVAGEAQRRGFYQAARRAFLGDGQAWNWTLQATHFSTFVPIADFVHPLGYVYDAARVLATGRSLAAAPSRYHRVLARARVRLPQRTSDMASRASRAARSEVAGRRPADYRADDGHLPGEQSATDGLPCVSSSGTAGLIVND